MKIAPIDIAHKTFSRKVMGVDPEEVASFLREIADQMEELVREKNTLREVMRQKDLQLMEYKERDETLKATLATATKMSEQIRQDAEREARLIIGDAQQKAELMFRDGRDQLRRIYYEIADLKKLRLQFETNIRAMCQGHISMVDQSHISFPDPQVNLSHAATVTTGAAPSSSATSGSSNAAMSSPPPPPSQHPSAGNGAPLRSATR